MARTPLSPEREAEAQQLAEAIRQAIGEDILNVARTLVATDEATLFGETEFQVRDLVHKAGAQAYQTFLAQKKTATAGPP
jgi:GGDEF domain-containing protein